MCWKSDSHAMPCHPLPRSVRSFPSFRFLRFLRFLGNWRRGVGNGGSGIGLMSSRHGENVVVGPWERCAQLERAGLGWAGLGGVAWDKVE